jgi:hypothetical protein
MKIGDRVLIKGVIVDFDTNPHGAAVKVELDLENSKHTGGLMGVTSFWVHRLEQSAMQLKDEQIEEVSCGGKS